MAGRLGTTTRVLLLGASAGEAEEVELALTFVELALESGDVASALERSGIVLERARSVARADLLHRALLAHGRALESNGRLEDAIEVLDDLVGLDGTGLTWARGGIALCRCTRDSGDLARAIDTGETVRARLTAAGLDGSDESVQLTVTLASAYHERGDVAFAARLCRDAVRRAEATGSPTARASAYWNASMVVAESGDVSEALPMAERALALLSEGSDSRNVARLRSMLASLQLAGDPPQLDPAEENLERADAELRSSSASPVDLARNTLSRARVSLLRGDPTDAVDLASEAYREAEGLAPAARRRRPVGAGPGAAPARRPGSRGPLPVRRARPDRDRRRPQRRPALVRPRHPPRGERRDRGGARRLPSGGSVHRSARHDGGTGDDAGRLAPSRFRRRRAQPPRGSGPGSVTSVPSLPAREAR